MVEVNTGQMVFVVVIVDIDCDPVSFPALLLHLYVPGAAIP